MSYISNCFQIVLNPRQILNNVINSKVNLLFVVAIIVLECLIWGIDIDPGFFSIEKIINQFYIAFSLLLYLLVLNKSLRFLGGKSNYLQLLRVYSYFSLLNLATFLILYSISFFINNSFIPIVVFIIFVLFSIYIFCIKCSYLANLYEVSIDRFIFSNVLIIGILILFSVFLFIIFAVIIFVGGL